MSVSVPLSAAVADQPVLVAADDKATIRPSTIVAIDVLANDRHVKDASLRVVEVGGIDGMKIWIENGLVQVYASEGLEGTFETSYVIEAEDGSMAKAVLYVTVDPKAQAPVTAAADDAFTVPAGEIVRLDLLANDTFANGKNTGVAKIEQIDGVKLWIEDGQAFAYIPQGHTGPITFAYAIVDSEGNVSEAKATLTVEGPATQAVDDAFTVRAGETVRLDLLANDVFANGKITGVSSVAAVEGVKLWIEDGQVYVHVLADRTEPLSFTYTIVDSEGVESTATATLSIDTSTKVIMGTVAGDVLSGSGRAGEEIWALGGRDSVTAGDGADTIHAGNGHDTVDAAGGDDVVFGGRGSDVLVGGDGADTLDGEAGADTLEGGLGGDSLLGGTGRDRLDGGEGDDALFGGSGNDVLLAGSGNDTLDGGIGADSLLGDAGDDVLWGGAGSDTLEGGEGNDVLVGGRGRDVLTGGAGADTFVWTAWNDSGKGRGVDRVVDFEVGVDKVDLSALFGDVEATWIGDGAFTRTAGEVRYDASSGMLWLDRDGNGVRDMGVAFEPGTALTQDDFLF